MRLGMFDPPSMQPFRDYSNDKVDTKQHEVSFIVYELLAID